MYFMICDQNSEKKEVRRLASFGVINIVRTAWLEECYRTRREVDVLPIHVASDLIVAKGIFTVLARGIFCP
jgi:hypothetical protein